VGDDNRGMRCDLVHEAISARLDDELPPMETEALDAHLAGCPSCQAYTSQLAALHRAWRVRSAEPVPDLTARILAATADRLPDPRPRHRPRIEWARYGVFAVGLTQLVLALPLMLLGSDGDTPLHATRELGAFAVALSVGMLVAAWQPQRASGLLPVALALGAGMVLTGIADVVAGHSPALGEAHHVLELLAVFSLWRLARATPTTPPAGSPHRTPLAA
jgi:predicted anti-sigma-YlaC factor YlaD